MILDAKVLTLVNIARWREQLGVEAASVVTLLAAEVARLASDGANYAALLSTMPNRVADLILTGAAAEILVGEGNVLLGTD
jgi:hypothetical protein